MNIRQKIAVILVTHKRIQIKGGIERMIELLSDKLMEQKIQTTVVYRELFSIVGVIQKGRNHRLRKSSKQNHSNKGLGMRTFHPPEFIGTAAELFFSFVAALRTMSLVKKYRKKGYKVLIHAMDTVYGGLAAVLASIFLKVPMLSHTHGVRAYFMHVTSRNFLVKHIDFLVEKVVINHSKKLISVNKEGVKFWIMRGVPHEKIELIPIFIETDLFSPSGSARNAVREELGIEHDSIVYGYIGRLSPEKNVLSLLKAFQNAGLDAKLLIVGDGPEMPILKKYVKFKGLDNKVIFTGFRNDVHRIINAVDVLVLPSLIEGTPTVILEAYANGKPVIASDIRPIRELVSDGGILYPPKEIEQFKKTLVKLYYNNKLRKQLGENALKKAQQYSVDTIFPRILKIYKRVLTSAF